MGMGPKKIIRDYWSTDILHSNQFIPRVMSKHIFGFLCSALHAEIDDRALDSSNENQNQNQNENDMNNENEEDQNVSILVLKYYLL